jgi:hypothetical protein
MVCQLTVGVMFRPKQGPKPVGKFHNPNRSSGSIYVDIGFSDRSMWMTEFSFTHMFWACGTLGLDLCPSIGRLFTNKQKNLQY